MNNFKKKLIALIDSGKSPELDGGVMRIKITTDKYLYDEISAGFNLPYGISSFTFAIDSPMGVHADIVITKRETYDV